ncbi:hypothetical protein [Aeromonas bestiarum]|uniref:hypothetical protein n=1 Tax=Aeromonas bestiarum TaxID=105751 RepID=UPI0032B18333
MTFILNVLHKDMSLLAADRKATAKGPTTITMPGITIHAEGGATIHGYKKLSVNKAKNLVLGIAGNTQDHAYSKIIENSASIDDALLVIRTHMEQFLSVHDRAKIISFTSSTENQGIASFFDEDIGTYFSNIFLFSPVHNYTRLYARTIDGARLLHVGSGSDRFEEAVGLEEINSFIASLNGACTPEACIPWIQDAYKKVSELDAGTGEDVVFEVSTRTNPEFRSIENG